MEVARERDGQRERERAKSYWVGGAYLVEGGACLKGKGRRAGGETFIEGRARWGGVAAGSLSSYPFCHSKCHSSAVTYL
jgi:hypothetical protein